MIKTKPQQKPITSTEAMARPPQKVGVGATYGDRTRATLSSNPANPVSKKSHDSFNRLPAKKSADLSVFAPRTAYKTGHATTMQRIPQILNKIQKGELVPVSSREVKRPTDNAILRFLEKVIALA